MEVKPLLRVHEVDLDAPLSASTSTQRGSKRILFIFAQRSKHPATRD